MNIVPDVRLIAILLAVKTKLLQDKTYFIVKIIMMKTKRLRQLGLASFAVLFLVACGQKGPLRMPQENLEKNPLNQGVSDDSAKDGANQ